MYVYVIETYSVANLIFTIPTFTADDILSLLPPEAHPAVSYEEEEGAEEGEEEGDEDGLEEGDGSHEEEAHGRDVEGGVDVVGLTTQPGTFAARSPAKLLYVDGCNWG